MTSNADCKKGLCHYDSASRTKFFNGMLLTDEHLRAEQTYHREALKRMNRYMWGAGIVCGFRVEKLGGFCIKVHPGFALDCEGNAIELCRCITIDLSDVCRKKYPDGCAPQGAEPITKCLMIRYKEIADETVPVLTSDDDCASPDGRPRTQASRVREGFCLEFSDQCPTETCEDPRRRSARSVLADLCHGAGSNNLPGGRGRPLHEPDPGVSEMRMPVRRQRHLSRDSEDRLRQARGRGERRLPDLRANAAILAVARPARGHPRTPVAGTGGKAAERRNWRS